MTRKALPKATQEQLFREYRHLCAICGEGSPQIHHINGNNSDNEVTNLIPLCPNCHLTDQHNPTEPLDPDLLALFRAYKDPIILGPQFKPLFSRMAYLRNYKKMQPQEIADSQADLIAFVEVLAMGAYYAEKIRSKLCLTWVAVVPLDQTDMEIERRLAEKRARYISIMDKGAEIVIGYLIEMVRYQNSWEIPRKAAKNRRSVGRDY